MFKNHRKIFSFYFSIIIASVLFISDTEAQCFECSDRVKCDRQLSYRCDKGSVRVDPLTPEQRRTSVAPSHMFGSCVPYPFTLIYVDTYCCFSSPDDGCHIALHPNLAQFENNPHKYCRKCDSLCQCAALATKIQIFNSFILIGVLLCLAYYNF